MRNKSKPQSERISLEQMLNQASPQKTRQSCAMCWADEKTTQYFARHSRALSGKSLGREQVLGIFQMYAMAVSQQKNIPLNEIAFQNGCHQVTVRDVLKKAGLEALKWQLKYVPRNEFSPQQVLSAYNLGLSMQDIDFFIDRVRLARDAIYKMGIEVRTGGVYQEKTFNYKVASKTYRAQDEGAPPERIPRLISARPIWVSKALENRLGASKVITDALDILYPDTSHTLPYLPKKID